MSIYVFTGGAYPEPDAVKEFFSGKFDYVVAADSGLDAAEKYSEIFKFKIDRIIGDMDSLFMARKRLAKYEEKIITCYSCDKDFSDTELALKLVKEFNHKPHEPVVLVGGGEGRADHLFALKKLCATDLAPDVWLCGNQIIYCLSKNGQKLVLENVHEKDMISVFSCGMNQKDYKIKSEGLYWPTNDVDWEDGGYSLSNKPNGKFVSLEVVEGRFIVILSCRENLK